MYWKMEAVAAVETVIACLRSLSDHPYISAILTCGLVLLLTRLRSTYAFHYTAKNARHNDEPPIAPYWIPGLYHAPSMILNGPAQFFTSILLQYGDRLPLLTRVGALNFLLISSPEHVKRVFRSLDMDMTFLKVQIFKKVFRSPKKALDFYKADQDQFEVERRITYAHETLPRKLLSGPSLTAMTEKYFLTLRKNLAACGCDREEGMEIPDLYAFFKDVIMESTIETVMGSALLEMYPAVVEDFYLFDEKLEDFNAGTPRFMMPLAYDARDRLLVKLKEWDLASIDEKEGLDEDVEWNKWGSKFIRARRAAFRSMPALDANARASENLGILEAASTNILPSVFWFIIEALRNPDLRSRLKSEIEECTTDQSERVDVVKLGARPLLQSMHAETARRYLAIVTARTVTTPNFTLEFKYGVRKGTTVMIFSNPLAMNTSEWAAARPSTVRKPLEEFWAERFLTDEGNFSVEGIAGCWVPFGGGKHMCPGRHFAKNVAVATAAVLLGEYECEFMEPEKVGDAVPKFKGAYAVLRPKEKIRLKLRKADGKPG